MGTAIAEIAVDEVAAAAAAVEKGEVSQHSAFLDAGWKQRVGAWLSEPSCCSEETRIVVEEVWGRNQMSVEGSDCSPMVLVLLADMKIE